VVGGPGGAGRAPPPSSCRWWPRAIVSIEDAEATINLLQYGRSGPVETCVACFAVVLELAECHGDHGHGRLVEDDAAAVADELELERARDHAVFEQHLVVIFGMAAALDLILRRECIQCGS
jgi:hypothetical protein